MKIFLKNRIKDLIDAASYAIIGSVFLLLYGVTFYLFMCALTQ